MRQVVARRALMPVKRAVSTREPRRGQRAAVSLADAAALWLTTLRTGVSRRGTPYSPASLRLYAHHVDQFVRWCDLRTPDDLSADLLRDHLAALRRAGAAAKSIAGREGAVRLWYQWLADKRIISEVSFKRVRRVAAPDPPVQRFTPDELTRLYRACSDATWGGVRDTAILRVLLGTGLRVAELCALTLADYDRAAGTLTVQRGKGGKRRTVGVPDDAAAALEEWVLLRRGAGDGPLITGERDAALSTSGVRAILRRLGKRAAVEGVRPHRARHSFAITALQAGLDIYILSRLLGHASVNQTASYARSMTDDQAAQALKRVMGSQPRRRTH